MLLRSVIAATTAVLRDGFESGRVREDLKKSGEVTLASLVPTMLQRLREADCRGLRPCAGLPSAAAPSRRDCWSGPGPRASPPSPSTA